MPLGKKEIHFFTRMALQTHFCINIIKALLIKTQEKKNAEIYGYLLLLNFSSRSRTVSHNAPENTCATGGSGVWGPDAPAFKNSSSCFILSAG